jgi:hypothetical protein
MRQTGLLNSVPHSAPRRNTTEIKTPSPQPYPNPLPYGARELAVALAGPPSARLSSGRSLGYVHRSLAIRDGRHHTAQQAQPSAPQNDFRSAIGSVPVHAAA